MIVHCTKKLAAKLPGVSTTPLSETSALGSWHGNLYIVDRRQCVLFCHDKTRFVLFVPGLKKKDFAHLDFWFADLFANTLLKLGYDTRLLERALAHVDALRFDTACDRSVQGTMNALKWQDLDALVLDVPNVMDLPPYSASARLNERPVHIKGMKRYACLWPDRAMRELIGTLD